MHDWIEIVKSDLLRLGERNPERLLRRTLNPRFYPVLLLRISKLLYNTRLLRPICYFVSALNTLIFSIEVTPKCNIGGGLLIPHSLGTVIGALEIGENVTIFQGVTLGARYADFNYITSERPIIGDNVVIGAGSVILGPIKIGKNVTIAPNSLVTTNVPPNSKVMGNPAIISLKENEL